MTTPQTAPRTPALRLHDLPVQGARLSFTAHAGDVVLLRGGSPELQFRLLAIAAGHAFGGPGECSIDGTPTRELDALALGALRRRATARVLRLDQPRLGLSLLAATAELALQRGLPSTVALTRAAWELDQLGLGGRLSHPTDRLTPAEQRLLLLARAKVCRPCVLVAECLDAGLDAGERAQLRNSIADAAVQGSCVLLTADHPSFAAIATHHVHIGAQASASLPQAA